MASLDGQTLALQIFSAEKRDAAEKVAIVEYTRSLVMALAEALGVAEDLRLPPEPRQMAGWERRALQTSGAEQIAAIQDRRAQDKRAALVGLQTSPLVAVADPDPYAMREPPDPWAQPRLGGQAARHAEMGRVPAPSGSAFDAHPEHAAHRAARAKLVQKAEGVR